MHHHPPETDGGSERLRFITEADLYRLTVSTKLPTSQAFETWVFASIRRHGVCAIDELFANDEFLEEAIVTLRVERIRRVAAQRALLNGAPRMAHDDIVLAVSSLITTTEIAKDYGLSAKKLNQILLKDGVQFRQPGRWLLCAGFTERGYAQSKVRELDGGKTRAHMYWAQKGRLFIYDLLTGQLGLLPVIERGRATPMTTNWLAALRNDHPSSTTTIAKRRRPVGVRGALA